MSFFLLLFPNLSKLGFLYVPAGRIQNFSYVTSPSVSQLCLLPSLWASECSSTNSSSKAAPCLQAEYGPLVFVMFSFLSIQDFKLTTCRSSDYDWGFQIFTHFSIFSSITKCPCIHKFLRNTLRNISMLVI